MTKNAFLDRFAFAVRNVFRHRARSMATLAAISVGVAGLILAGGFVQDIFVQLGEAVIHSQTGHLQVTRSGFREGRTRNPDAYRIESPDEVKSKLADSPLVERVAARLSFTGTLNNGRRDLGIVGEGIEPEAEGKLGAYMRYVEGRPLEAKDVDGMVVGQGVARSLNLKIGERVTLVASLAQGAVNTLDFEVVGVFQSFSKDFDARAVRIPVTAARDLLDTRTADVFVVMLHRTEDTRAAAVSTRERLGAAKLEVMTWNQLSDFYEKAVDLYERQFGVLRLIILLMVLLSVANSVNMTLFERTREFGTMLALGDRPSVVFTQIMIEGAILGVIGSVFGVLLGCGLAALISSIGIPMPPPPNANLGYTAVIRLVPHEVAIAGAVGFVATCLATIMPGRRAARCDVVEALRHGT